TSLLRIAKVNLVTGTQDSSTQIHVVDSLRERLTCCGRVLFKVKPLRYILFVDGLPGRHNNEALDDILKFTDVARPMISSQYLHRLRGKNFTDTAFFVAKIVEKVLCQQGDIFSACPKRRHVKRDDIQPVEEVFTKPAIADLLFEMLVCRSNDTNINFDCAGPADTFEFSLLKDSEDFSLGFQTHVTNFIEKEILVGQSNLPLR
ncbi:MAG: hypothetical protein MZW92_15760, partial [Comamonadaceae bacterium]|nr:hypothetical protein [Comamonadaceae bacterium]